MIVTETKLNGVFVIDLEKQQDERGFFARTWCKREFERNGLNSDLVQCNVSFNRRRGTLRGMHYQTAPCEEVKLVRCTAGAIFDVVIDLRSNSPSFMEWIGVELSASNHRMLYVPERVAHGFQTLEDDTEVFYQMSEFYAAAHAAGIRWNDPTFSIQWPPADRIISARDAAFPDFVSPGSVHS
jgi:dTDP-4-dehydrorhamnose 3,5-epimerase